MSHCIDCTGIGFDVLQDPSPLIQQLLREGLVRPHAFGGLDLDADTLQPRGRDALTQGIYITGHYAKGTRYLTSGVSFLRAMSRTIVGDIARSQARGFHARIQAASAVEA